MDKIMNDAHEMLKLLKGEDPEDVEYFTNLFDKGIERMSSKNNPHHLEQGRTFVMNAFNELGERPLPGEGTPQIRIPNVVAFRGSPESPRSSAAIHCDVQSWGCGFHGHRYGDGTHDCTPVSSEGTDRP